MSTSLSTIPNNNARHPRADSNGAEYRGPSPAPTADGTSNINQGPSSTPHLIKRNNSNNSNVNYSHLVDTLMVNILDRVPLAHFAQLSVQLRNQIKDLLRKNIVHLVGLMGGVLSTAGLAILAPSLAVVIVNAIGFTSAGVLKMTLATTIQSVFYQAYTSGLFSVLQSFGATAAVAPAPILILGGIFLGLGFAGIIGWKWFRTRKVK